MPGHGVARELPGGGGLSVRRIVEQPQLRIEIVSGATGLDNLVTWAHSSDLPDPSGWLTGGEIVMKNGRTLPRGARLQEAFMSSLARAHASALFIGMYEQTPHLTVAMAHAADTLRLPLLQVPFSVPFAAVGKAVADYAAGHDSGQVTRIARVYAFIQDAVTRSDPARFVAELGRELGHEVFVIDAETGTNPLPGAATLPPWSKAALMLALQEHGGHVPALLRAPDTEGFEVVGIAVPNEEPTLLVIRQPAGWPVDMPLLQHAATAAAVAVAYASRDEEHRRELGTELLGQLLDARLAGEVGDRELSSHGIDAQHARLLATRWTDNTSQRQLYHRLRSAGVPNLLCRRHGTLFLLVNILPTVNSMKAVTERLRDAAPVGVSDAVRSANRMPEAEREARWALAAAQRSGGVVPYGSASAIPALRDAKQAQALVDQTLGPLIEHDRATNADLVNTLAVFLTCRRSWVRTAEELNVHKQTVIYRIRKIERITRRDLTTSGDIAEIWLALTARQTLIGN
jgi:purine catabolism regulator